MAVVAVMGALFFVRSSHGYKFPSALALQSVLSIKSSGSILNHASVPPTSTSTSITSSTVVQQQRQQRIRQFLLPRLQASAKDNSAAADNASLDVFQQLKEKLRGTCVYFVGMMGSGKTTLGRAFSEKMEYRFLDTDEIAEYMIEMPISAFFAEGKVDEFRELENKILTEVSQYTRVVVATGGGIVIKQENWGLLRHGIVVYVDMPVEDIYQRLVADPEQIAKRPLLQDADPLEKLRKLSAERQDKYSQADVHFRLTGQIPHTPEELATMCAQSILDFIANNPPLWESWKKKRDMEVRFPSITDCNHSHPSLIAITQINLYGVQIIRTHTYASITHI